MAGLATPVAPVLITLAGFVEQTYIHLFEGWRSQSCGFQWLYTLTRRHIFLQLVLKQDIRVLLGSFRLQRSALSKFLEGTAEV